MEIEKGIRQSESIESIVHYSFEVIRNAEINIS